MLSAARCISGRRLYATALARTSAKTQKPSFKSNSKPSHTPTQRPPFSKPSKHVSKSTISQDDAPYYRSKSVETQIKKPAEPKPIHLPESATIAQLSTLLGVSYKTLARDLPKLGINDTDPAHTLHAEFASLVAIHYNRTPTFSSAPTFDIVRQEPADSEKCLPRPPVVTVMGHVDHGKTTLLDSLRKTTVAAGEAGGITQHIGAFSVVLPSKQRITFLDTPGHAAFSAMRERGAKTTDIVILVVAADDGVMPQTIEAIKHAMAADVPIVVAINKCDKPHINIKRVKEDLLRHQIVLEDYGGEIQAVEVSAKTGLGLDVLEETVLVQAEVMDLRGDTAGAVEGVILESKVVRGRGNVATVLVKRGTLKPGSIIVAGTTWAKVRSMHDENNKIVKSAGPSFPVEVTGWKDLPAAGDEVLGTDKEELAKRAIEARIERARRERSLDDIEQLNVLRAREKEERQAVLKAAEAAAAAPTNNMTKPAPVPAKEEVSIPVQYIILKSDVHGSLEAITEAIGGIPSHEARIQIVSSGVGPVNESDVDAALATNSHIVTFNTPADKRTLSYAAAKRVPVTPHQIIYNLLDHLKSLLSDLLPPDIITVVNGEAEIAQVFMINVKGKLQEPVAGSRVISGKVLKNSKVKILRAGEVIFDGTLKTFRHHKKDIHEAAKGLECGLGFDGFDKFESGDIVQSYNLVEKKRKIT
ncbi:hypothetical protein DFS34DRAFT_691034 [Phlyctochytrium arcticum]|nr:hypothetical protein DFS34DRAFT_691034 [Phlyctochytrium arcticum]